MRTIKIQQCCLLLVTLLTFSLSSCSKDDDSKNTNNDNVSARTRAAVIGTWTGSDTRINLEVSITFSSNGTGTLHSVYHGPNMHSNSHMNGTFTWSCSGTSIKTTGYYLYTDYKDGTVDDDYDPEVNYEYTGTNLTGGRYSNIPTYKKAN